MDDEEARNPEFPRRLYTKGDEPFPSKNIGYYSNDTKLFDELYKALEPDEWDEIRDSRLGVFLRFNRLQFEWASRLVHYMLCFQLVCNKKYEIWSLVGSNPLRFSLNEFEGITGLNCEAIENLEQPEVELTEEMEDFWEKLGVSPDSGPSIEQLTSTFCEGEGPNQECTNLCRIWVYESMPDFAKDIGEPIAGKPTPPLLAYRGSRGRKNVKEGILKQICFNHFKIIGDMLEPVWEDDDIYERIDNIMRAFKGEFGSPWKWSRGLWEMEGIYVSNNEKVKVKEKGEKKRPGNFNEASVKRHCPGPSTAIEFNLLNSIKQEINSWGAALLKEMKDGFSACESRFHMLNDKVEGLATDIAGLKVKGDAGANSKAGHGPKDKTASTEETEKEECPPSTRYG